MATKKLTKSKKNHEDNFDSDDEIKTKKSLNVTKFSGSGSSTATNRIMSELESIIKSQEKNTGDIGRFLVSTVGDDLYHWEVRMYGFEKGSDLDKDFKKLAKKNGIDHINLEMRFPSDFPFSPIFLRIVRPRFQFHSGRVTVGGSLCTELLTKSGWSPCTSIESVLVSIFSEIIEGKGRIDFNNTTDYTESEARAAFERVSKDHGWS